MHQMAYDVLLGMDILVPLRLALTLTGTKIFPPPRKNRETCTTELPIPMNSLKPGKRRRVDVSLKAQIPVNDRPKKRVLGCTPYRPQ